MQEIYYTGAEPIKLKIEHISITARKYCDNKKAQHHGIIHTQTVSIYRCYFRIGNQLNTLLETGLKKGRYLLWAQGGLNP